MEKTGHNSIQKKYAKYLTRDYKVKRNVKPIFRHQCWWNTLIKSISPLLNLWNQKSNHFIKN